MNGNHEQDGELPGIVHQAIAENMPVYEYLKGFAFQGANIIARVG